MLEIHSGFLRAFLILLSLCIMGIFALPVMVRIVNLGNAMGFLAGFVLFVFALLNRPISRQLGKIWQAKAGKITLSAIGIFLAAGILLCLFLSVCMVMRANRKPQESPKAVIVLGCKVRNGVPSRMLRRRLESAKKALDETPDAICIVSGGQGTDESITEAQCMFHWLTENGVDAERIFMEDKSTSTFENLSFSKKILDEQGISDRILIATDGYHEMRAQMLAAHEGLTDTYAASAQTSWYLLPTYWVREWFGIVEAFVLE